MRSIASIVSAVILGAGLTYGNPVETIRQLSMNPSLSSSARPIQTTTRQTTLDFPSFMRDFSDLERQVNKINATFSRNGPIRMEDVHTYIPVSDQRLIDAVSQYMALAIPDFKRFVGLDDSVGYSIVQKPVDAKVNSIPFVFVHTTGWIHKVDVTTIDNRTITLFAQKKNSDTTGELNRQVFKEHLANGLYAIANMRVSSVFFDITSEPLYVFETPIIEYFHHAVAKDSFRKMKALPANKDVDILLDGVERLFREEEQFVHAVGYVWLCDANKRLHLGLSDEILRRRLLLYEPLFTYKGTAAAVDHINKIGIPETMRLWKADAFPYFK